MKVLLRFRPAVSEPLDRSRVADKPPKDFHQGVLGIKAIEAGYGVYFVRAHELLEDLRTAQAEHRLERRMRVYLAPKVLVIDEFGVWPYDRTAATALFCLISARYERGSVILQQGLC